jgi:ADP-ribosyl-[dinitrogen reductase] hydrolase
MARSGPDKTDRFRGCLLGLATGDAIGGAYEGFPRGEFTASTEMAGGGPWDLKPGEWTDDTSMALCLATSLLDRNGFDADDQMKRYLRWAQEGYLSSKGHCFDIGGTVTWALHRYRDTGEPLSGPTDPASAGNGCIMRLAPVPMFYFPKQQLVRRYSVESSRTTHGALECLEACRLFGEILHRALAGKGKEEILFGHGPGVAGSKKVGTIARGDYREKEESDIESSGYVVHTLKAALWCFLRNDSFEAALLAAVNLGGDTDTTAAVCGQVAGAFYGESGIPDRWLEPLVMCSEIGEMADRLRTVQAA